MLNWFLRLWDKGEIFDLWFNRNSYVRIGWSIGPCKHKRRKCKGRGRKLKANCSIFRIAIGHNLNRRHGRRNRPKPWFYKFSRSTYHINLIEIPREYVQGKYRCKKCNRLFVSKHGMPQLMVPAETK